MSPRRAIHLLTDHGTALCGIGETLHGTVAEAAVSCSECRAFLQLRAIERNLTERRLARTIARVLESH